MRKRVYLLIALFLISYCSANCRESATERNSSTGDSIKVFSSPDMFNLSVRWAGEYCKLYPETKISVVRASGTKINKSLISKGNIGLVSNEFIPGFADESVSKIVIGRDVIVLVINSKNPYIQELSEKGVSQEVLLKFLSNVDSRKWGTLLRNNISSNANYIWINDASIIRGLSSFLNKDQIKPAGTQVKTAEEFISSIQKDPSAIGFCKMINIEDLKTQGISENIRLLPIDRNGNGIIDSNEKIYEDLNAFSRGVWIGKYPKSLVSNLFSVSSGQLWNESEIAFMKWILTDGQQYLYSNGYSDLLISERQSSVSKIDKAIVNTGATISGKSIFKTILLIIAVIILVVFLLDALARYLKQKKTLVLSESSGSKSVPDENALIIPKGIYFDKTHTWAYLEQDGMVRVGIDDFLQHITGTITRIIMRNTSDQIKKGDKILTLIQNGKQLNLYAPVSGAIKEKNKLLETNSTLINSSPYEAGWIYKIEPTNWGRENQLLFMAEKQRQFIQKEFSRLKEFLAAALVLDSEKYASVIMQDGGELSDGTLSNLGPEVWDDFQTKFIDPSRQVWFYEIF
jgi:glycine cleavage system H lipoate-binding protein/ABC-type phosphate transport system substrate-binding protein